MNTNSKKLSLNLPPELCFALPKLARSRVYGKLDQITWAEREYRYAERKLQEREARERVERERQRVLELQRRVDVMRRSRIRCLELREGVEPDEPQAPAQSSQKGWRRLLSEHLDLRIPGRYGEWGDTRSRTGSGRHSSKHGARKPCYKDHRARR